MGNNLVDYTSTDSLSTLRKPYEINLRFLVFLFRRRNLLILLDKITLPIPVSVRVGISWLIDEAGHERRKNFRKHEKF